MHDNEYGIDLNDEFHHNIVDFTDALLAESINKNNTNHAFMIDINKILSDYVMIFNTIGKAISSDQPLSKVASAITRILIQINNAITQPQNKTVNTKNEWQLVAEMTQLCEQPNIINLITAASQQIPAPLCLSKLHKVH